MPRQNYGTWGLQLDHSRFAQALTVASIAAFMRPETVDATLTDWLADLKPEGREGNLLVCGEPYRDDLARLDPLECVQAFEKALKGRPFRLEVVRAWDSPRWLCAQLAHPAVGAEGVYARIDEPSVDVTWEWPIWIGLLDDRQSRRMRERLEMAIKESRWMPRLIRVVNVAESPGECDLLLLPYDLREALAAAAANPTPIRADCTMVLGRGSSVDGETMALMAGLRGAVRTSGVILANTAAARSNRETDLEMLWLTKALQELTHNRTLDGAVLRAARSHLPGSEPPFVTGAAALFKFSRIATQVRETGERFRTMAKSANKPVDLDAKPAYQDTFKKSTATRAEVAADLEKAAGQDWYYSELSVASAAAELADESVGDEASARESRFLQARVFSTIAGDYVERKRALQPETPHEIIIRIAAPDREWLSFPKVFPDEDLPRGQREHRLRVILADLSFQRQPLVETIVLPGTGPSTEAAFAVQAGDVNATMLWRVIVSFENRVLQTALLRAPVRRDDSSDHGIMLEPETFVRPTFDDLSGRSSFDAALVINKTPGGEHGVVAHQGDSARSFSVSDDMKAVLAWFDKTLSQVATNPSDYKGELTSPANLNLLRMLAQQGSLLYGHVVQDGIGETGLTRGERLHLVSAEANARLPLEFIYDRIAPTKTAQLCASGLAAMQGAGPACTHAENDDSIVCPMSFWGVQKIIERHAFDPELKKTIEAGEAYAVGANPARGRQEMKILRSAIAGANYRVDKAVPTGMKDLCGALKTATKKQVTAYDTWDKWKNAVINDKPSLLVAIVHNENTGNPPTSQMEVGTGSWIEVTGFNRNYVRPTQDIPAPAVLLLSCESASPLISFNGFVTQARRNGAGIVMAAGARIHARHAVELACELVGELQARIDRGGPLTFGAVFRDVRRRLMAKGKLMALTIETYGDADWLLT